MAALLALGAVACGDDDGMMMADAGPSGPVLQTGDGPDPTDATGIAIDPATAAPADYACLGMGMRPTGGEDVTFDLEIKEFRTDDTLGDLCVRFYADNMPMPGDTCDPESDLVTDGDGVVEVTAPANGWYAYRVFPKEGPSPSLQIAGSVQINEPAPEADGGSAEGNSVSQATLDLIPTVLGFSQVPGTAVVAGTVFDCAGDPVYGAEVRLYREDGSPILEGTANADPHYRYFDGDDFPSADQPYTHVDGLFATANIPVASDGEFVFMELWGRLGESDTEAQLISCERLPVFGDTISIVNLEPLRADAPACPGAS
ncbi:MAG: hypothetical protein CMN31_27440 [Sandaracinus sp.]|nr:hypothetical protein [Sandaracinus sp.]